MSPQRLGFIQIGRVVACVGVIAIHAAWGRLASPLLGDVIYAFSQLAVPFFFAVSGYFFTRSFRTSADRRGVLRKYVLRILLLYVVWYVVYLLFPNLDSLRHGRWASEVAAHAREMCAARGGDLLFLVLDGPAVGRWQASIHLWFLPSLAMALTILFGWLTLGARRPAMWIGLTFAACKVATFVSLHRYLPLHVNFARDLLVGTPFVILGSVLAGERGRPFPLPAVAVIVGTIGLMLEQVMFVREGMGDLGPAVSLIPITYGLIVLAIGSQPPPRSGPLIMLGRLTLGIYLVHMIALQATWLIAGKLGSPAVWSLCCVPVAFLIACAIVLAVDRIPVLRKIIK